MHAHFDCFSGISGDMVLGAFVDLGISTQWLRKQIGSMGIENVEISAQDVKKNGIGAKKINIMEKSASHARNFRDIVGLIERGSFSDKAKNVAVKIFRCIAQAEGHIHRCKEDDVHFHEVGAVDSIVDIVGVALCLDYFDVESISSSALPLGSGFVDCAHGRLPVPAPATLEILKGIPVYGGTSRGEMVTPTGAGIIASLSQEFGPIPEMAVSRVGYGSGSNDHHNIPNLLRILIGERIHEPTEDNIGDVCSVETNIDDMNPEFFGYIMEKLLVDGALDVCFTPVTMKKNRPGIKVEVLCPPDKRNHIAKILMTETTTIGVRYHLVHRQVLKRSISTVTTRFGSVQVKGITDPTGRTRYTPEYETCKKIAFENKIPLQLVYETVANTIYSASISDSTQPAKKTSE